jgi:Putative peptidoglycan binding domain
MRWLILPLFWGAIISAPVLNGQQASPGQTAAPQRSPKPSRVHVHRKPRAVQQTPTPNVSAGKPASISLPSYSEALRRYSRERHSTAWWNVHFPTIVFVGGGYYYWDAGYWCPAWGYDPNYESYDYDGPIYTYGNLLPDQVILNVQRALKDLGYYAGDLTGALSPATRRALSAYQQDYGLEVNGVVDGPTVQALGLI